jgi:hypothetical protein
LERWASSPGSLGGRERVVRIIKYLLRKFEKARSSPAENGRCYPWGVYVVATWNFTD